jgi:GNAT superfamily N-acetyltransferase
LRADPGADFARALAFENAIRDRLCDVSEPFEWGTALFTTELPAIYDANFLRVERAGDTVGVEALIAEADRLMGARGLEHRKLVVDDETLGETLAPGFRDQGYLVDRMLFMVHRRPPERTTAIAVDEIEAELHIRVKEAFNRQQPYFENEDSIKQMNELARMMYEVTDKRSFAAYVDGDIASVCELYSDGITAQIEDVVTLEEHRNKGLARATVLRALHEAEAGGHETVFLVADADDWPKEMYRQLGFDDAGRTYQFRQKLQG